MFSAFQNWISIPRQGGRDDRSSDESEEDEQPTEVETPTSFDFSDTRTFKLDTPIQPRRANHSYSGLMFDVTSSGLETVEVLAFHVAGQLGEIKVYASTSSWHTASYNPENWILVGKQTFTDKQDWSATVEVKLSAPVQMPPGSIFGFYIHSNKKNDRGLIYQSYSNYDSVIIQDANLGVLAGIAHTSSEPFDQVRGWWRSVRGLAGSAIYRQIQKRWNYKEHNKFPIEFQKVIILLLLCKKRPECALLHDMPLELIFQIFECLDWKWWQTSEPIPPTSSVSTAPQDDFESQIYYDWDGQDY